MATCALNTFLAAFDQQCSLMASLIARSGQVVLAWPPDSLQRSMLIYPPHMQRWNSLSEPEETSKLLTVKQ